MTAAQIQARVDAWLAAHSGRPAGDRAAILASQWRHVCVVFGPASAPALGVLLGLVREAWGCLMDIEEYYTNTGTHQFEVSLHDAGDSDAPRTFRCGSLASALIAALEAAP